MDTGMQCPKCGHEEFHKAGPTDSPSARQRYRCKGCGHRTTDPRSERVEIKFDREIPECAGYVITAAQNATLVFKPFFDNLVQYCDEKKYELIVVPFRYRNPTSKWELRDKDYDWWDEKIIKYACSLRTNLSDTLTLLADIKIRPTAVNPLVGLEAHTGHMSGIVAHPQISLRVIPTPNYKLPKIMVTTGAVTKKNYSDSKAGKKGEFHHSFGACVVECPSAEVFHLRQINAMRDGSFMDLDWRVNSNGIEKNVPVEALIMGDSHIDFIDPDVVAATFTNKDSIVKKLKPKYLVWHDLLDSYSISHHHRKKPFTILAKHKFGRDNIGAEIKRACDFVDTHTPKDTKNIIVPSNHHDHLMRWIEETDWKTDPENAELYLETALEMAKSLKMTDTGASVIDPFILWADRLLKCRNRTLLLTRDKPFMIRGIEVGMHGDVGPSGTRGSVVSLAKIGVKSIIGHLHTPNIRFGCYQVGTSTRLTLEYTRGPSSWLNTHCLIYANGKRSLINIIDGNYRS